MTGETFPAYQQTDISLPCPDCLAGRCRMDRKTLLLWLQNELITVQNFPIWVCDFCGWREYDPRAILWLKTLFHLPALRAGRQISRPINKLDDPVTDWMRVIN